MEVQNRSPNQRPVRSIWSWSNEEWLRIASHKKTLITVHAIKRRVVLRAVKIVGDRLGLIFGNGLLQHVGFSRPESPVQPGTFAWLQAVACGTSTRLKNDNQASISIVGFELAGTSYPDREVSLGRCR